MLDRRDVLKIGAAGSLAMTAVGVARPARAAASVVSPDVSSAVSPAVSSAALPDVSPADWQALARALSPTASLYRPADPAYDTLSVPFNRRYRPVRPAGIVTCVTTADVVAAVQWARAVGLPAVPRSGLGHNYAGYSTTTGLLLNMSRMKLIAPVTGRPTRTRQYGPIQVAHNAGTVTVGAGVTNGDVHPLLEDKGMFVPTGRCPSVGVAGLVLGGGIGFSDKMFGLTCDRLLSTTVVLADGSVVRASQDSNQDLFWAVRGGAGNNFGVHTSFTFGYDQFAGDVAFYDFKWSIDSVLPVMAAMQAIAAQTLHDKRFHCRLGIGTHGQDRRSIRDNANVNVIGQHYGTVTELLGILAPLLAIGTDQERVNNLHSVREVTPGKASDLLSATTPVDCFAAKSAILTPDAPLDEPRVKAAADLLTAWPGSANSDGAGFAMFGMGGRVNEIAPDATAFVHRDAAFILAAETTWAEHDPSSVVEANLAWLDEFYDAIFPSGPPQRSYQNFPDPTLDDWRAAYYGPNYDRLVTVKQHYDPDKFFTYPQAIGSSG
ncbi:FAD-binding oxidoreductase [Catenulispora yoronensis]|uniref:FAD-binding oxidoreductase n=1 Tax=Catenulispora yoronensis TaxID=450799 RepID=A0ABP5FQI3_9ACTN